MKFIKRNKLLSICIFVFLCLLIVAGIGIYKLLVPESGNSLYGNRLDGIESVTVSEETIQKIKTDVSANAFVVDANYNLEGKLMNYIFTVVEDANVLLAKALSDKVLANLSEEEKSFYDIQIFIKCSNSESEVYPIIGYKKNTSLNFTWTNN